MGNVRGKRTYLHESRLLAGALTADGGVFGRFRFWASHNYTSAENRLFPNIRYQESDLLKSFIKDVFVPVSHLNQNGGTPIIS